MDKGKLRRLVLRLKPGESLLVKVATGHSLVIRRDASDSNKFLFEEETAPEGKPYFVIRRNGDSVADAQLLDDRFQRQRWLHRFGGEVSGGGI